MTGVGMKISKEEQGERIGKIFFGTQGKHYSRGTWQRGMAQRSVDITLAVDKW